MVDDRAGDLGAEVRWAPSETRSESEYVDSLVKKLAIGVPKEQLWIDAGYTPKEIQGFKTMLLEEGIRNDAFMGAPQEPTTDTLAGAARTEEVPVEPGTGA